MTADKDKDVVAAAPKNTHCLICNSRFGVSSRNCCEIFTKNLMSDDRPVSYTISAVLGLDMNEDTAHSNVVCKKCFKLLYEVDEIETRLVEIKTELTSSYKRTLKIQNDEELQHDIINDDNRKLPLGSDDNNIVKYKLSPKMCKKTMKKNVTPLSSTNSDEESEQKENTLCEVEMSEHGSDSEYTLELPQEEQELAVDHDGEQIIVQIKMEPEEDMSDKETNTKKTKRKRSLKEEDFELPDKLISKEGTEFSCCLCLGEEKLIFEMKGIITHMKTAHNIRIYICDICGQDFRKRNDLSVHLDEHVATEEGDFQCEVCNRIFSNLRLFRVHKRMHYPQNKLWTCETCGKRYSSRNLLDEHINTHTGVRPYMCQTCGKDFASKYTFKAHTKTHEIRPRPYVCGECHKSFLSAQNLQQHERTHNGMRNYVCDQCGKAFGTARNLEVHAVVHTGYKPYVCRVCGKAFARKAEIRDHERTHTGEKPYQCEFCGATFSQRSNLQSHKRATHYQDKRYKCNDCGKGFKRRRLLDYHMKAAHTGERPYKCPTCEATFVYPEHFKKHRRIHTGEKPFHCEVCGKAFNSRDNRNAHRFVHSDKKPYECLVCGMGFMRKPLLYNHMQTQGHLNDTIVVNQPRLTTDDDLILESSVAEVAAEIEEELNRADEQAESKLYITELKEHVVIDHDGEAVYSDKSLVVGESDREDDDEQVVQDACDHIIIDGQVHFNDSGELADIQEEMESVAEITTTAVHSGEGRRALVVPATPHMLSAARAVQAVRAGYEEEVTVEQTSSDQLTDLVPSQEMQTNTGAVHLVQIRIPSSDNPTGNHTWFNIVDNQE